MRELNEEQTKNVLDLLSRILECSAWNKYTASRAECERWNIDMDGCHEEYCWREFLMDAIYCNERRRK